MECASVNYCQHADRELFVRCSRARVFVCVWVSVWLEQRRMLTHRKLFHRCAGESTRKITEINRFVTFDFDVRPKFRMILVALSPFAPTSLSVRQYVSENRIRMNWIYYFGAFDFSCGLHSALIIYCCLNCLASKSIYAGERDRRTWPNIIKWRHEWWWMRHEVCGHYASCSGNEWTGVRENQFCLMVSSMSLHINCD